MPIMVYGFKGVGEQRARYELLCVTDAKDSPQLHPQATALPQGVNHSEPPKVKNRNPTGRTPAHPIPVAVY
jgi:hypothetical protein